MYPQVTTADKVKQLAQLAFNSIYSRGLAAGLSPDYEPHPKQRGDVSLAMHRQVQQGITPEEGEAIGSAPIPLHASDMVLARPRAETLLAAQRGRARAGTHSTRMMTELSPEIKATPEQPGSPLRTDVAVTDAQAALASSKTSLPPLQLAPASSPEAQGPRKRIQSAVSERLERSHHATSPNAAIARTMSERYAAREPHWGMKQNLYKSRDTINSEEVDQGLQEELEDEDLEVNSSFFALVISECFVSCH